MVSGWDRWRHLDERTPVVVGVGQAAQDLLEPGAGDDAIGLMIKATMRAGADCGAPGLLRRIERVCVPEGSWKYNDAARLVGRAVGADRARSVVLTAGIPQQTPLDRAYVDMLAGRIEAALVTGGESRRRTTVAKRAGINLDDDIPGDAGPPDDVCRPEGEIISRAEITAGVIAPVQQFALIDSSLHHAEGKSLEEQRDEIAELWAEFSRAASIFEHAAFPTLRTAAEIRDPGPDNPPFAFPYNKWHCSQMNVDQAAAILVATLGAARTAGVNPERVVFPTVALESSFSVPVPRRRLLHRWQSMEMLGARAAEHLGHAIGAIEHVELYSCFPAAVRVQRRALDLPPGKVVTITGGEPFAGGPWNNFVLQATVAMIEVVRAHPGERGMVTSVSGFLNKPALAVYSTEPASGGLLVGDLAAQAEAATPTVDVLDGYRGRATIAACTLSQERSGDQRTIVIADTPHAARCLATSTDPGLAARAMSEELIGTSIDIDGQTIRP
jgi:acetyl-CoA C-acetyltransferase